MIPEISALDQAAERVLRSVPPGLVRGEIATGLYGVGFLGRWALPRLKARGVRLRSCHDSSDSGKYRKGLKSAFNIKAGWDDMTTSTLNSRVDTG